MRYTRSFRPCVPYSESDDKKPGRKNITVTQRKIKTFIFYSKLIVILSVDMQH